jgi:glycosyltransferase involved in cell wall biosynthesis
MKEPVRVLMVVTQMSRGGMESRIMDIYRKIDKSKVIFDFLCHRENKGDYDDEIIKMGGRIYMVCPMSLKNYFKYKSELRSFFKEHPEYRIVHCHLNAMCTPVLKAAKEAKVPVRIAHSRTAGAKLDWKLPIRFISKLFLKKYATDYFACSELAGQWLFGRKAVQVGKVKIINNAIDSIKFIFNDELRELYRERLNLKNKLVIGHVGRFAYPKNHNFLIDIFLEIKKLRGDAVLILVGDGELKNEIQNKVNSLGLDKSVLFIGKVDNPHDYYQVFDMFLFPSHYEGLPGAVIEAQAAGLSCIISSSITKEVKITEFVEFISLKESAANWAEKVLKKEVIKRQNTYKQISKEGYDVTIVAKELEQYYEEALL